MQGTLGRIVDSLMRRRSLFVLVALLVLPLDAQSTRPRRRPTPRAEPSGAPQPRTHDQRVRVEAAKLVVDDGDTVSIRWGRGDRETVRVLGIDAPELRHLDSDLPYPQPFGEEARAFARRTFATASVVELRRAAMLDQYGRTLGYFFVDGQNYSTLMIRARLAQETVSNYGDNGFPKEAAEITVAAKEAGPLPFEPPWTYRNRMRDVSRAMKARGEYPEK